MQFDAAVRAWRFDNTHLALPAARVVATCAGRVAFASPFRSYGLLLIVDCGGGYHAVLAGFRLSTLRWGGRWPPANRWASCRAGNPAHPATGPRCMSNCGVMDSRSTPRRG